MFKYYYLPWFVIFGLMGIYGLIINWHVVDYKLILFLLFVVVGAPALVGSLVYWAENKWTPLRRKKHFKKEPFLTLAENGFENKKNEYFQGEIEGYEVFVHYDHTMKRTIYFIILFNPTFADKNELNKSIWRFKNKKVEIDLSGPGCLFVGMEIKLKMPDYEKLRTTIQIGITFLKENKLPPVKDKDLRAYLEVSKLV